MSETLLIALIQFAIKFGLDAAIVISKATKDASIDQVIAALEVAKTKTAQDYLNEAKAKQPPPIP